jgi:biotin operon repressor
VKPAETNPSNLPEENVLAVATELVDVLARAVVAQVLSLLEETPERRFLSKSALANHLGVSERTIKTLRERGLPARKVGRALYFDVAEVARFIDREGTR